MKNYSAYSKPGILNHNHVSQGLDRTWGGTLSRGMRSPPGSIPGNLLRTHSQLVEVGLLMNKQRSLWMTPASQHRGNFVFGGSHGSCALISIIWVTRRRLWAMLLYMLYLESRIYDDLVAVRIAEVDELMTCLIKPYALLPFPKPVGRP